ncbi:helix-turn-helix domain-containing protein [Microvirga massiliensis]|uniref:helix-turn-helix domain-containing protein n=1 Tax=Microvirga massiliensis TaxID=1033741 RepID=UPI001FCD9586|nr:helix-turn-helix domain-containing protein [Microvirga massiliensis]
MLTRHELAERWGCSERTIDRVIASGDLRAHRIGRSIRIAEEDAEVFLARRRIR